MKLNPSLAPLIERSRARSEAIYLQSALELLESALETQRIAGVFALENFAQQSPDLLTETLCALIRRRVLSEEDATLPPEVGAALQVLGRLPKRAGQAPLDLHGVFLRGASLPFADLRGAFLYDCNLEGALLCHANLGGAWLYRAQLKLANFDGADLRGADLSGARGATKAQFARTNWDEKTLWPVWE